MIEMLHHLVLSSTEISINRLVKKFLAAQPFVLYSMRLNEVKQLLKSLDNTKNTNYIILAEYYYIDLDVLYSFWFSRNKSKLKKKTDALGLFCDNVMQPLAENFKRFIYIDSFPQLIFLSKRTDFPVLVNNVLKCSWALSLCQDTFDEYADQLSNSKIMSKKGHAKFINGIAKECGIQFNQNNRIGFNSRLIENDDILKSYGTQCFLFFQLVDLYKINASPNKVLKNILKKMESKDSDLDGRRLIDNFCEVCINKKVVNSRLEFLIIDIMNIFFGNDNQITDFLDFLKNVQGQLSKNKKDDIELLKHQVMTS